jgi:hypothetical protein
MRWYPPGLSVSVPCGGITKRSTGCIPIADIAAPSIFPAPIVIDSWSSALRATGEDAPTTTIRDGAIPHADVAAFEGRELVGGFLARERDAFEEAYRETTLPEAPNEKHLSKLLVDAHCEFYGWR